MGYQISVSAHWLPGIQARTATVYDMKTGDVVARGVVTMEKTGGPITVRIPGFRDGPDWSLLNTGQGPGEWVCTGYKTNDEEE